MFDTAPVEKSFGRTAAFADASGAMRGIFSNSFTIALGYFAIYVVLDWVSYLDALDSSGITPWNPTTGLSVALIIVFGRKYIPLIFIAMIVADGGLRGLPLPIIDEISLALLRAVIFGTMLWGISAEPQDFSRFVTSRSELFGMLARVACASTLFACFSALILNSSSVLTNAEIPAAILRSAVGDGIGVVTLTPFLLVIAKGHKFFPFPTEVIWPLALLIVALAALFGFPSDYEYQFFYPLFLPIIWVAVRFGFEPVVAALLVTHVSLIVGIEFAGTGDRSLTSYQIMMLVLSATGLTVGSLLSEQRRTERELWLHREALERSSRATQLDALAATIAHEINQPLTAVNNYVQNIVRCLDAHTDRQGAIEAAQAASLQVTRAAEVIKRLRDYVSFGGCSLEDMAITPLVMAAVRICDPYLKERCVSVDLDIPSDLPFVRVDSVQIEQVIINLIRNSVDSFANHSAVDRVVSISARAHTPNEIEIVVADNGPGFDPVLLAQPMSAFTTTKPDGMGLGLTLSRSILKAHKGALTMCGSPAGARVAITLPVPYGNKNDVGAV